MKRYGMKDHYKTSESKWMCYDGWYDRYFFTRKEDVLKKAYSLVKKYPYREDPIVYIYSISNEILTYTSEGRVMKRLTEKGESVVYIPNYGKARIITSTGSYREVKRKPAPFGL